MYFDPYYLILVVPAVIISLIAQFRVTSAFNLYKMHHSSKGLNAEDVARKILDNNNLHHVDVRRVSGNLTDHFDPRSNTVNLSQDVFGSSSIAAIGIAAHEVGHAIQYAETYMPMKIRGALIPAAKIGSNIAIPLAILGIFFGFGWLTTIGIFLFCGILLFQIVTLPVEFNASSRALEALTSHDILNNEELQGAKKVLSAAAMTYVAAVLVSLMNLLRLLLLRGRNDD